MRKTLIITAITGTLLFSGLWAYVRSDDFGQRIRPFVEGPLLKALGPGARIGPVRATLFPLSLEARDIAVPFRAAAYPAGIRRIRLYINPFPLLYKTISITSVNVLEPRVEARRDGDGHLDLADLVQDVRRNIQQTDGGPSAYSVKVGSVTIRNGTARFFDAGSASQGTVTRLNMKVSLGRGGTASVRLSSGRLSFNGKSSLKQAAELRAAAVFDREKLILDELDLKSEEWAAAASGSVDLQKGEMNIKASLRIGAVGKLSSLLKKRSARRKAFMESEWLIRGAYAAPEVEGKAALSGIPLGALLLETGNLGLQYRDRIATITGKAWEFKKGAKKISLRELSAKISLGSSGAEVLESKVLADDASASATGRIDSVEGFSLAFAFESWGGATTLSALTGIDMTGVLSLRGSLSGPLAAPEAAGTLSAGPLSVREVPFQHASGAVLFQKNKLSLTEARISQDGSRYIMDGSVDFSESEPRYDATLRVIKSDVVGIVALFYKRIPLDLSAQGELAFSGTSKEFSGRGRLDLGPGVAYGEPFDHGVLTAELTTSQITFTRLALHKSKGLVTGTGWIGFDGTYSAHVASSGVDLSEVKRLGGAPLSGPFTLDIRSSGPFSKPVVNASVETDLLTVRQAALGQASCRLEIADGVMHIAADVKDEEKRSAGVRGDMRLQQPYPWSLRLSLDAMNMDLAGLAGSSELLERIKVSAQGDAEIRGQGGKAAALNGALRFSTLSMMLDDYRIGNEGIGTVNIDGGKAELRPIALAGPGTKLTVSGSARSGEELELALAGDVNLSLLRLLYQEVEHGDGNASVLLAARGGWSDPDISGELTISNGQIKIKDIPQKFTSLNGTVAFDREGIVSQGISGEVGGGTVTLSGSAKLADASLQDFSAKAVIDNITVRYPQGLTAVLGGSLFYDGDRSVQTLSGELAISKARYEKRVDWKSMLMDFRAGFTRKKKVEIGWIGDTQLNLHFFGKESILFESNLAKIPVDVDMLLHGTVNQPQVLGRLEARKGEVYFRKNVFRIVYASADFADPNRINPLLDVLAETRVREYQIRLSVSGAADRAFVSFASDPPLTNSNILAMLTIGRKSEEVRGREENVGMYEAASFMTGPVQDILENRARSLTGLDRFQVDPYISKADVSVPRVTVGKEVVQDKMYMTYSQNVGADTPEQMFRIEYLLNRNLSLVGERDEIGNVGADLKFRFEFR